VRFRPLIICALACASSAFAYEEVAPPKNVALPPARSPADSLASITVAPASALNSSPPSRS
jgi:hypothetical protein